jgi:hypothetical protein
MYSNDQYIMFYKKSLDVLENTSELFVFHHLDKQLREVFIYSHILKGHFLNLRCK